MLGTVTLNAYPERSGPAVAIVVGDAVYLVDAGPGIVRRAAQAARDDSIPALAMPRLRRVFLTHLHSDHTTGLPDLIFSPWVLGRTDPLDVYGPTGTRRMVGLIEQAYSADVQIRLHGGEPSNKTGYVANAHDVVPGVVYLDSNVTVTAFKVEHGKWDQDFGYRLATLGCDVLVHEVYSAERLANRPPEWQRYHAAYHTSTRELAAIATRARPKLLVLYHQLYWGANDDDLLRQVRALYKGEVVSAHDLGVY
jgi:ribonuclease BN (tRNA processing enzyme)